LCPSEVIPLVFKGTKECMSFLTEQGIEGTVIYKLARDRGAFYGDKYTQC